MRITVHLHTVYQKPTENGLLSRLEMELKGGSTLAGLVKSLGLEINPDDTLLVLNGKIAEPPTPLSDGDRPYYPRHLWRVYFRKHTHPTR